MAIYSKRRKCDGEEMFYIRFQTADGQRIKEKAGTTYKQAKKKLRARLGEVAAGTYVSPKAARAAEVIQLMTFNALADRFVKEYRGSRRTTYYESRIKVLKRTFGEVVLSDITSQTINLFALTRERSGEKKEKGRVGASTLRKELTALGTIFRQAKRWGLVTGNPVEDVRKPKEPKRTPRYFTPDEWQRLESAASPWLKPILTLCVLCGLRLKEAVSLTWDCIDWESNMLHVAEDSKTGTRPVPFGPTVRRMLEGQVRHLKVRHVFVDSEGEPYTSGEQRNMISKVTKAAVKAAKIEGASFMTTRSTAASWAVQHGAEIFEVQHILGHTTPTMTMRYAYLKPEHLRKGIAAIEAALTEAGPQVAPCEKTGEGPVGSLAANASRQVG